jgi:hypothetical protein
MNLWFPSPRQQFVETVDGMSLDHAREYVVQVSVGLDTIEFAGFDQRTDDCPTISAAVAACEQMVLATEGHCPFILPISGKKLKSIIVGIRCFVVASRFEMLSSAAGVGSSISTRATVRLGSLPNGCWMLPLAPLWFSANRASA